MDYELVSAFKEDLKSAAALREHSLTMSYDNHFVRSGGRIMYALDSAILNNLFSVARDRKRVGQLSRERDYEVFKGGGGVAPADFIEEQRRLRHQVLWHILDSKYSDQQHGKLLILPGHSVELRNLYDGIVEDFSLQDDRLKYIDEIAGRISLIPSEKSDLVRRQKLLEELEQLVFDLAEPHQKFIRLNGMLQSRKIVTLHIAQTDADFNIPVLRRDGKHIFHDVIAAQRDASIASTYEGSLSWWDNRLHGRLPERFRSSDNMALSALDSLNRQLAERRARVVLFTENAELLEAGRGYKPLKSSADAFLAELTFTDLYLRHPKSLLVDPRFIGPTSQTVGFFPKDLDSWLSSLLSATLEDIGLERNRELGRNDASSPLHEWASFRELRNLQEHYLEDDSRLETALVRNPELHTRLIARWTAYIRERSREYATTTPFADAELKRIVGSGAKGELSSGLASVLAETRLHVRNLTFRSWSHFYTTAADVGLELAEAPSSPLQPLVWSVPTLFISGGGPLQFSLRQLWDPKYVRTNHEQILAEMGRPDQSPDEQENYVETLRYGLLFAVAGRWSVTRLLALRAVEISEGIKSVEMKPRTSANIEVTGREAYYLAAVTSRVLARTKEDYTEARRLLDIARSISADFADESMAAQRTLSGIRFEAERLAQDLAHPPQSDEDLWSARQRIKVQLDNVGNCQEKEVGDQTALDLRSTYFATYVIGGRPAVGRLPPAEREMLSTLVSQQLEAADLIYGGLSHLPLRDFALVRLGVAVQGPELLHGDLVESSVSRLERLDITHRMKLRHERVLSPIENAIDFIRSTTL